MLLNSKDQTYFTANKSGIYVVELTHQSQFLYKRGDVTRSQGDQGKAPVDQGKAPVQAGISDQDTEPEGKENSLGANTGVSTVKGT